MKYLSVCSGIEAASVAWEPMGWKPKGFCEIEPFPAAVLAHRWPEVQNHGDMTKHEEWKHKVGAIDLLAGGTPCQSFSVAGLRKGLKDPRGGLMLTFLEIAKCFRPRWIVWENVPGVLSSHGGRDFGSFLGALGDLGYGWAYRVLDAQWFGLAQRRKRVFVVGCLGDGASACEVLFESESVCRDNPPSRETRQGTPSAVAGRIRSGGGGGIPSSWGENIVALDDTSPTLLARDYKGVAGRDFDAGQVVLGAIPIHDQATRHNGKRGDKSDGKGNGLGVGKPGDPAHTLTHGDKHAVAIHENQRGEVRLSDVAGALTTPSGKAGQGLPVIAQVDWRTANSDKGEVAQTLKTDLAHQSGPCIAFPIDAQNMCENHSSGGKGFGNNGDPSFTLTKSHAHAVAVDAYNQSLSEKAVPIGASASDISHTGGVIGPKRSMAVRRLTVLECERLQGFPDGHTKIPWRGKPAEQCSDGPRYKALGNSMAVNCMRWIGERIDKVHKKKYIKPHDRQP